MNYKTYTISGKRVIHRPLSPMQLIRLAAIITELQHQMAQMASVHQMPSLDDDSVDMTVIYQVLNDLETKKPELITRLINTIFIDADTNRPCYLTDRLTLSDFYEIDPPTFLEVVADFFTLNDASKTSSMILSLMKAVTSATSASPELLKNETAMPKASANG